MFARIGNLFIALVVLAACAGIALVAVNAFGITIPVWVTNIFGILVIAMVAIAAIRFVLSL